MRSRREMKLLKDQKYQAVFITLMMKAEMKVLLWTGKKKAHPSRYNDSHLSLLKRSNLFFRCFRASLMKQDRDSPNRWMTIIRSKEDWKNKSKKFKSLIKVFLILNPYLNNNLILWQISFHQMLKKMKTLRKAALFKSLLSNSTTSYMKLLTNTLRFHALTKVRSLLYKTRFRAP